MVIVQGLQNPLILFFGLKLQISFLAIFISTNLELQFVQMPVNQKKKTKINKIKAIASD
jgi:hypothetical protein